jgi:hypothetical protein
MPEMISGSAFGTSTRQSTWWPVMPIPWRVAGGRVDALHPGVGVRQHRRDAQEPHDQ